jgi:hypothetical protein
MSVSRKTRNRFNEHDLEASGHWSSDRDRRLFFCRDHCDWLGWIPVREVKELLEEKEKGNG